MARTLSSTVTSGTTATVPLNMKEYENGFQISVTGAGTLAITYQIGANAAYTTLTSISDEGLIVDLYGVTNLKLTASVADVPYSIRTRDEKVSTPQSNWTTLNPSTAT